METEVDADLGIDVPQGWQRDGQYVKGEHGVLDAIFSESRAFLIEVEEKSNHDELWFETSLHIADPGEERYVEFARARISHPGMYASEEEWESSFIEEVNRLISVAETLRNIKSLL